MSNSLTTGWNADGIPEVSADDTNRQGQSTGGEAAVLIDLMKDCTFATDAEDEKPLAIVPVNAHRELHPVDSRHLKGILRKRYFECTHKAPKEQAFNDALRTLEAHAMHGVKVKTWLRVAEQDDVLWLDLCDEHWRAVRITATGWEIVAEPPVYFRRNRGMDALPEPQPGGEFKRLWMYLNVREEYRPLVAGFIVNAFRPTGALPHLDFTGEQGTAKSTSARVVRSLIDPSTVPLRPPPRNEDEFLVSALGSWVVCLDNLSGLPPWLSDALCRLATGGGLNKRALYTDTDQVLADIRRPAIINGIEDVASRPDLAERTFVVELSVIQESERRAESEFWQKFEAERPRLLGAILDALSMALRNRDEKAKQLQGQLPRMADVAIWASAAESALGFEPGAFMAALRRNQDESANLAVEHSPVALALQRLMADREEWHGSPTALLQALTILTDDSERHAGSWPKTPATLSQKIKRAAPALRRLGIQTAKERSGNKRNRLWTITRSNSGPGETSSASSARQQCSEQEARRADEARTTDDEEAASTDVSLY